MGLKLSEMPAQACLLYVRLPDGTFASLQSSADGQLTVSSQIQYNIVPPNMADGGFGPPQGDANGNTMVALAATVYNTDNSRAPARSKVTSVTGTPTATLLKTGGGKITDLPLGNNHATNIAFLKMWDTLTPPTVGVTATTRCYPIPPNGGSIRLQRDPIPITNNLYWAITGGPLDSDTAAVLAAQVTGEFVYI